MIVFAHMMKTAGTSFTKMLIWHFGNTMLNVSGGLNLDNPALNSENLATYDNSFKGKIQVISGHPVRPYIDFDEAEKKMRWITFVRNPEKRFVSHYLHSLNWDSYYRNNPGKSILEWERRLNTSNYQVKFLAGEENLDKAIEIIHQKMDWIGVTEKFEESICSFKNHFDLQDFFISLQRTNSSLSEKEKVQEIFLKHADFITEKNELDRLLYKYVCEEIWPKQIKYSSIECDKSGKNHITRELNFYLYQLKRHSVLKPTEINKKNLKRFYRRWLR